MGDVCKSPGFDWLGALKIEVDGRGGCEERLPCLFGPLLKSLLAVSHRTHARTILTTVTHRSTQTRKFQGQASECGEE